MLGFFAAPSDFIQPEPNLRLSGGKCRTPQRPPALNLANAAENRHEQVLIENPQRWNRHPSVIAIISHRDHRTPEINRWLQILT